MNPDWQVVHLVDMFRPDKHTTQSWLLSYPGRQVEQLELRSRFPMHSEQFVLGSKLVAKHVWQSVAGSPPGRAHALQSVSVNLSGCRQRVQLVTGSLLGRQLVQSEVMSQPGRHWVQSVEGSLLGRRGLKVVFKHDAQLVEGSYLGPIVHVEQFVSGS